MARTFLEFFNKQQRDTIKELKTLHRILTKGGLQVASHLHTHDDPYLFVYNPGDSPSFGLRIYKLGGESGVLYYRPQNKESSQPWGESYELDLKGLYEDIGSEDSDETESGEEEGKEDHADIKKAKNVIKAVCDEIKDFFKKSAKAEKDKNRKNSPLGGGYYGKVAVKSSLELGGGDFSNQTYGSNSGV